MATKQAKRFKNLSLRYILRFHSDDAEFEAECIDAGATGLGATQQEALQDLIVNLEALHGYATKSKLKWLTTASADEVRQYAKAAAGQRVDPAILGYGAIQRVEIVAAVAGKKAKILSPARFELSLHNSVAA